METLLVQVNNNTVYRLLEDLEALRFISVQRQTTKQPQKISEKYAGKLPSSIADELQQYVTKSRNEWESHTI
jgi:DNA-binding transcriptional regulator YhcF (GntR family)